MADGSGSWFSMLQPVVTRLRSDGRYSIFESLKNNKERIEFCENENLIRNADLCDLYNTLQDNSKNLKKANTFREYGNHFFQKRNSALAIDSYNKALMFAPKKSDQFSLSIANRSAVLFEEKAYQECINDIKFALNNGYPKNLWHKVYYRLAQCYIVKKRDPDTLKALESAEEALEAYSSLGSDGQVPWLNKIKEMRDVVEKHGKNLIADDVITSTKPVESSTFNVTVKVSDKEGRYLVTNKCLDASDVAVREKAFASILIPDYVDTRCFTCYENICVAFPCHSCSQVKYCSQECAEISWNDHHQYECLHLDFCHSIGVAHLALRMVLKVGVENISRLLELYGFLTDEDRMKYLPDLDKMKDAGDVFDSYSSIYHLISHSEEMHCDDLLNYSLTAMVLLKFLAKRGFFNGYEEDVNVFNFVGSLLLTHIQQIICNANAITEIVSYAKDDTESGKREETSFVRVGSAIYPICSLLNHSCEPNVITSYHKDEITVRVIKDSLGAGDALLNCYGPHFARHTTKQRRMLLQQQYYFDCDCCRCRVDDDGTLRALRCPLCSGPINLPETEIELADSMMCSQCKKPSEIKKIVKKVFESHTYFVKGEKLLNEEKFEESLTQLQFCYSLRHTNMYRYNMELGKIADLMAKCLAFMGRHGDAVDYVMESLEIVKHQYGAGSIEVAAELQKLADLRAVAIKDNLQSLMSASGDVGNVSERKMMEKYKEIHNEVEKALKVARHAEILLVRHYGENHINTREIRETIACLKSIEENSSSIDSLSHYLNSKLVIPV